MKLNQIFSARSLALAASVSFAAMTAPESADAYSFHNSNSGVMGGSDKMELVYPDGSTREFIVSEYANQATDLTPEQRAEKKQVFGQILIPYIRNVLPHMPQESQDEFHWVVEHAAESVGVSVEEMVEYLDYDIELIHAANEAFEVRWALEERGYLLGSGRADNIQNSDAGSFLFQLEIYSREEIERINANMADLRAKYPDKMALRVSDVNAHDLLERQREIFVDLLFEDTRDVVARLESGRADMHSMSEEDVETLIMASVAIAAPDMLFDSDAPKEHLNGMIPALFEAHLIEAGLNDPTNSFYNTVFKTRGLYDFRILPNEDDFMNDVIVPGYNEIYQP